MVHFFRDAEQWAHGNGTLLENKKKRERGNGHELDDLNLNG